MYFFLKVWVGKLAVGFYLVMAAFFTFISGGQLIGYTSYFFWSVLLGGISFGIPHYTRNKAKALIRSKTQKSIQCFLPAYHQNEGKGYLAITEDAVLFVKKEKVYQFPIEEITYMQWGAKGTGNYDRFEFGSYKSSTYFEETVPVISISGHDFEHTWILRTKDDVKKGKKALEKIGNFETELDKYQI